MDLKPYLVCFLVNLGAAIVSTQSFYEASRVLEQFKICRKFDLSKRPEWLTFKLPKNFDFIDKMIKSKKFDQNSSLGAVLAASLDEDLFDLPFKLKQKVRKTKKSTLSESTSDVNMNDEVLNYWNLAKQLKAKSESKDVDHFVN